MTPGKLNVTTEGDTELKFVKTTLAKYLWDFNIQVFARSVQTSPGNRGGMTSYIKAKTDIIHWLKQNPTRVWKFTTMFDLYALPRDFPGYEDAKKINNSYQKVKFLEDALKKDINDSRFIPYIQLHEFEALVLAKPGDLILEFPDKEKAIKKLEEMVRGKNPELIDGSPESAPSKRIINEIKTYRKNISGPNVVESIGIPYLKEKCSHFGEWITTLAELFQQ